MPDGLLITGVGETSGKSLVTIGLLRQAAARYARIGFLRPITSADTPTESRIVQLAEQLLPEGALTAASVMTAAHAEELVADDRADDLIAECLGAYERLAAEVDFVIIEGTNAVTVPVHGEPDVNVALARHLDVPLLAVVDGSDRSAARVAAAVSLTRQRLRQARSTLMCIVVNRVSPEVIDEARTLIPSGSLGRPVYLLPYVESLSWPSVEETAEAIEALRIGAEGDADHLVRRITVAAMEAEHALSVIGSGALVVVPGDRVELIDAVLQAALAPEAVIISGDFDISERLQSVIDIASIPVYQKRADTFAVAQAASQVRGEIGAGNPTRTRQALKTWDEHADGAEILSRFELSLREVTTPERFAYELARRARAAHARIVLPEGGDPRILTAAAEIAKQGLVDLILLGDPDEVSKLARLHGVRLDGVEIIDIEQSPLLDEFAQTYQQLRAHKGVTLEQAARQVRDPSFFGTLLVHSGRADGMVSGAVHTTADTIRPAFQIIKTRPGATEVSSVFLMCLPDRVLVYGDCAVIPNPTPQELAGIAVASAQTAAAFGIEPRVAMLSYSTGTSGRGSSVDAVREATELARAAAPDLPIEGPIQYDAASNLKIAAGKLPDSPVAGRATVFVFPDLNTGNNTYKAVQQSSGAIAIGPVLQGLRRPVNDLSRGCTVDDVVNTILVTAVQAGATKPAATQEEDNA
ncbi:phosphate acetyltransferase [Pseudoclavibacter sp. 13-3]|uniref:phosphate acetyltransferase n=1 Tax=Pseudoclavibacter sp. 13-3 TaxID=2901228 RepID=UPI001E4A7592|nr:phosphate acetyltransferase [Pseudoclavibacter sp. 13-3]MCD7100627.1 phosphate acetyltransferase [Pseudoclavibacter sp. 13-3]